MGEVKSGVGGRGTHLTLSPPTPPKMSEFDLTNVRIERVANGVIVECNYKMKPGAESKAKKGSGRDYVDYDVRNPSEKHAFNDLEEASAFITARLLGKEYSKPAAKKKA